MLFQNIIEYAETRISHVVNDVVADGKMVYMREITGSQTPTTSAFWADKIKAIEDAIAEYEKTLAGLPEKFVKEFFKAREEGIIAEARKLIAQLEAMVESKVAKV